MEGEDILLEFWKQQLLLDLVHPHHHELQNEPQLAQQLYQKQDRLEDAAGQCQDQQREEYDVVDGKERNGEEVVDDVGVREHLQQTLGEIVFSPLSRYSAAEQGATTKRQVSYGRESLRRSVCNWKIGARLFTCRSCGNGPLKPSVIVTAKSSSPSSQSSIRYSSFDEDELNQQKSELPASEINVHIPVGKVGLAWFDSEPLFLPSGSHFFPANCFSLQLIAPDNVPLIHHGSLHRIFVADGQLGVVWIDGHAELVHPGSSVWSCSTFALTIADESTLSKKEVVLGPFRIVRVDNNEVGVKFCNRKPMILYPGRHVIDISKGELFDGFESVGVKNCSHSNVLVTLKDESQIEGEVLFHWRVLPDDAAAARAVGVTEIASNVVSKLQRAFALVFWEFELKDIINGAGSLLKNGSEVVLIPSELFSSEISKNCIAALMDMFEEGWSVTFEDFDLQRFKWYECSNGQCFEEPNGQFRSSGTNSRAKKKVQIQEPANSTIAVK